MQTEVEAKSLAVNHDTLRVKLRELGAVQVQPMRLLRRYNLDYPDHRLQKVGGWVRIRDEGNKVTMSYKQLNDRTLHGTKEVNVTVSDFEHSKVFLESLGLMVVSYQETKRESWRLGDLEIELDEWPWINPFIEIEGPDETTLRSMFKKLGLPWETAVFGSVEVAYQAEYDVTDEDVDSLPSITFEEPVPGVLQQHKKAAA